MVEINTVNALCFIWCLKLLPKLCIHILYMTNVLTVHATFLTSLILGAIVLLLLLIGIAGLIFQKIKWPEHTTDYNLATDKMMTIGGIIGRITFVMAGVLVIPTIFCMLGNWGTNILDGVVMFHDSSLAHVTAILHIVLSSVIMAFFLLLGIGCTLPGYKDGAFSSLIQTSQKLPNSD
jgi:hypothetical protein